jgi:hypothetical protein
MPDLNKVIGKNMEKKPSGKLSCIQRYNFRLITILIVLPSKTNRLTVKRQNSRVTRDNDSVFVENSLEVPSRTS